MKKTTTDFASIAAETPVARPPKLDAPYRTTEHDYTSALLLGMVVGAVIALLFGYLALRPAKAADPLDYNHDGKVTAQDLLLVKRLEIQIKDRILGITPEAGQ